ncbi:hypothetical protein EVAR_102255_1 [Eumeta japonica]|uniref:Uncharacterized protein n=1 Tax=Eumeta variegata TaxID=151549 RepID=A0A4C1WFM8_EUMVA|nr:hypothetical protein EVAR_102255_1 [Eumeta japonica]
MMIAMKIPERKLIPLATPHIYRNEHVECRDRRDIPNGGSTESASRETSHPRDVTTTIKATRRLQELELREIRAAKALAKTDRALGQLYDDEECLDTCHETVEIPTDRSYHVRISDRRRNWGDKGTRTNEHVQALPRNGKSNSGIDRRVIVS